MREHLDFYIDGEWVAPALARPLDVLDPATEAPFGRISLGSSADVYRAVAAARRAFAGWSRSGRQERLALFDRIIALYEARAEDLAEAITQEMGAPPALARKAQVPAGLRQLAIARQVLCDYDFEAPKGATLVVKEPIGVCGLITPWNWPLNQIACKVAPALAVGCTMVLKPSEIAPFSAHIFAEILHEAGTPPGVFNMVHGDGPGVGAALSAHPDVDMISFTGSTRAGVEVARSAAASVKRVHQELGGKSASIVLDDAQLARNVARGVAAVAVNSGQSCNAPTRLLIPAVRLAEAVAAAREAADKVAVADPSVPTAIGPVVSQAQFEKVQGLIEAGVREGAELVAGGPGRPAGLERGWYVRPTVFVAARNDLAIAREEIFGPVLTLIPYADLDEAVAIANDSDYGLAAYVNGQDLELARSVARRLRAGQVGINGASDPAAPFGGYRMSGNGRERGEFAFDEFLEVKALLGYAP
jgi:aldehyde dehydrogenase (NAD+)